MKGRDYNSYKWRKKVNSQVSDRAKKRKRDREGIIKVSCNHHLWKHIDFNLKNELKGEYLYGTNAKWCSNYLTHPNFVGTMDEFIDYVAETTDRLDDAKVKYRNIIINSLVN